jgi:hypothetical protein
MNNSLLDVILNNDLWFALPLVIVVSLVYAATRHEAIRPILRHARRFGTWVVGFMVVVFFGLLVAMRFQ